MVTLFDDKLGIDYSQFYIRDPKDRDLELEFEAAFEGLTNDLCGTAVPGLVFLIVDPQSGTVELRVELLDSEPTLLNGYDDVVECSFRNTTPRLHVCEMFLDRVTPLKLPVGDYVVRYSIKGKELVGEPMVEGPVPGQHYVLQFWPGALARDRVVRASPEPWENRKGE